MATTRRCGYWHRAAVGPRLGGSGHTFATSGRLAVPGRRPHCFYSPNRKGEHPRAHLEGFSGLLHADGYAGFNGLTASPIAKEALDRIGQLYSSTPSSKPSTAHPPTSDCTSASSDPSRSPRHWRRGPKRPCPSCRANPSSPRPSATCGRAGRHWPAALTTATSASTTIRPSASPSAARITSLPDLTPPATEATGSRPQPSQAVAQSASLDASAAVGHP
jgi:hypothetical protein